MSTKLFSSRFWNSSFFLLADHWKPQDDTMVCIRCYTIWLQTNDPIITWPEIHRFDARERQPCFNGIQMARLYQTWSLFAFGITGFAPGRQYSWQGRLLDLAVSVLEHENLCPGIVQRLEHQWSCHLQGKHLPFHGQLHRLNYVVATGWSQVGVIIRIAWMLTDTSYSYRK